MDSTKTTDITALMSSAPPLPAIIITHVYQAFPKAVMDGKDDHNDIIARIAESTERGEPFVFSTVVDLPFVIGDIVLTDDLMAQAQRWMQRAVVLVPAPNGTTQAVPLFAISSFGVEGDVYRLIVDFQAGLDAQDLPAMLLDETTPGA